MKLAHRWHFCPFHPELSNSSTLSVSKFFKFKISIPSPIRCEKIPQYIHGHRDASTLSLLLFSLCGTLLASCLRGAALISWSFLKSHFLNVRSSPNLLKLYSTHTYFSFFFAFCFHSSYHHLTEYIFYFLILLMTSFPQWNVSPGRARVFMYLVHPCFPRI